MTLISAIIMLGVLIFVHELGHFIFAKLAGVKVLKFSLGFGPKLIGKKIGETEYLIAAVPLGGYVKMLGEDITEGFPEEEKERAFQFQPLLKRTLIVLAGPVFNILLTYSIYTVALSAHVPINIPNIASFMPVVDEVTEGSPADSVGLKSGDRIIEIDGRSIDTWFDMVAVVRKNPRKALHFVVKRGERTLEYTIVPERVEVTEGDENVIIGRIGVVKSSGDLFRIIESESFIEAPYKGALATYKMGFFIFDSIKLLISGEVSFRNIGGPVTIIKESGRAASAGLLPYFMFMALFSVNLGVLNLFPIPVLDGGHLLFFVIERLKGGPLDEKTMVIANKIGIAILFALMFLAFYNDIMRIFPAR